MRTFWKFFGMQVLAYGMVDCGNRFVAQGDIILSVPTGMLYAVVAFYLIKSIEKSAGKLALWGYVIGGGVGTFLGIVVSRAISGR